MSSKNNPGSFDCLSNAAPDEEMFVLLGRDPSAGALVRAWANIRELQDENPAKVAEARACAARLDAWCVSSGKTPMSDAAFFRLLEI